MTEIETTRLLLRQLKRSDLDALAQIYQEQDVIRYRLHSAPASRKQTLQLLQQMLTHWEQYRFGRWAWIEKATRSLIGHGGLERLDESSVEVNYLVAKSFWGRGLATEAAQSILNYGFEELNLERLVAIAHPANVPSRRVMEKLGMKCEKPVEDYGVDWVLYAMNRDQWKCLNNASDR